MKYVNITKVSLMLLIVTAFSGCTREPNIEYRDRVVKQKVPVKCDRPKVWCSEVGSIKTGTLEALMSCIVDFRENDKICR